MIGTATYAKQIDSKVKKGYTKKEIALSNSYKQNQLLSIIQKKSKERRLKEDLKKRTSPTVK